MFTTILKLRWVQPVTFGTIILFGPFIHLFAHIHRPLPYLRVMCPPPRLLVTHILTSETPTTPWWLFVAKSSLTSLQRKVTFVSPCSGWKPCVPLLSRWTFTSNPWRHNWVPLPTWTSSVVLSVPGMFALRPSILQGVPIKQESVLSRSWLVVSSYHVVFYGSAVKVIEGYNRLVSGNVKQLLQIWFMIMLVLKAWSYKFFVS